MNRQEWKNAAAEIIDDLPPGYQITGEGVRSAVSAHIGEPHHHNSWGAVVNAAVRRGTLVPTGDHVPMAEPSSHARKTPVYTATNPKAGCHVSVSFFKPYGFEDKWFVAGVAHRWLAVERVMERYTPSERACLNYVSVDLGGPPARHERVRTLT